MERDELQYLLKKLRFSKCLFQLELLAQLAEINSDDTVTLDSNLQCVVLSF